MKIQTIFNSVAILFFLVTLGYFVGTYLENVPTSIKAVLIFMTSVILFVLGDLLLRRDI